MYVWNYDGVRIFDVMAVKAQSQTVMIHGNGMHVDQPFKWIATVTPEGWNVTYVKANSVRGSFQGATFNMLLEIAAGAKRVL